MQIRPVILSGGAGARLWPLSREQYPKQLLTLVGGQSLLQATANRSNGIVDVDMSSLLVVCNEDYRFVTAEQLREERAEADIILEPIGRGTAPALTLAALAVSEGERDPLMLVMPADHLISDVQSFRSAVGRGGALAEAGSIVTFGVPPDAPETGYGYIKVGQQSGTNAAAYMIERFVEKPDRIQAQQYIDAGDYFWNSGIFLLRASVWLSAIGACRPDVLEACLSAWSQSSRDGVFLRVGKEPFAQCPADSIDYAVMENLSEAPSALPQGWMIPLTAGWSDVGAWDSLWRQLERDEHGNATRGDVVLRDCKNSLVLAQGRLVTCLGMDDAVVVETPDAVLVMRKGDSQNVRKIVEYLKAEQRSEVECHRKVYRPWGFYDSVDRGERFVVKHIVVKPGASLSLQMHHHRAEHWVVVRGTARVTKGDEVYLVSENESTYIPLGCKHRLENPGHIPLEMIEVQSGTYLEENDIVRFDDVYGR